MSKLWGGRFNKKINPLVEEFTKSIYCDYQIAVYDLIGSRIHVAILEENGYLTSAEASKLEKALHVIFTQAQQNKFKWDWTSEDIHTNIQNVLEKKVGRLALKLQTARSRNEQVVFATKLYCKLTILPFLKTDLEKLINSIQKLAEKNKHIIIPGFTHLQHAQPIYLKDYLGAYLKMLRRDMKRMDSIRENIELSMGAGALAGTPIDVATYQMAFKKIKGELADSYGKSPKITVTTNPLDAVSDRDFVIEMISASSMMAMHLSRIAEDLIIWLTKEFDFIEIDEAFCTGSSLMPQKKNPDVLELIRGYAGRIYGNLVSVLTLMKGLPLTYNRDMQLDKEPLFNSLEIVSSELRVLTGLIKTLKFNKGKIEEHLKDESLYATDLVYCLVDKGVAFKEAHTIIGKLVKHSIDNDTQIKNMTDSDLKRFSNKIVKKEIVKLFDPKVSVESKKSINEAQTYGAKRRKFAG